MSNPLSPHFVLVEEDWTLPGPGNLVYRAQSANFNYIFNQALMLKRRSPMKHVGIIAVSAEVVPFTCDVAECHMLVMSYESYLDPADYLVVPGPGPEKLDDLPF